MIRRSLAIPFLILCFAGGMALSMTGCPKSGSTTPGPDDENDDPPPPRHGMVLTPEKMREVKGVWNNGRNDIQDCFQRMVERKKNRKIKGKIIFGVTIGRQKNPEKVWIYKIDPRLDDAKFKACVKEKVGGWEFPLLGDKYDLTSPRYFLEVY